jgi:hypothetical protein
MIIIDFEASALDGGYPIEVGWACTDGRIGAHLIKPTPEWLDLEWSPKSEHIHGLKRDTCLSRGETPAQVLRALNDAIGSDMLVSDFPQLDSRWFVQLADAAKIPSRSKFSSDPVELWLSIVATRANCSNKVLAYINAKRQQTHTHTAAGDAAGWAAAALAIESQIQKPDLRKIDDIFDSWFAKAAEASRSWRPNMPVRKSPQ